MNTASVNRTILHDWKIQSSDQVTVDGSKISTCVFRSDEWVSAQVPTTVLAALVQAGEYTDPYVGENLETIDKARFERPWWYRCEFEVSEDHAQDTSLLEFDGINHAANIYLNGQLIADSKRAYGTFRRFCFDVSDFVHRGINVIAAEVFPPKPGEFSTGFVDWNPLSPDRNMGLFRPVTLHHCQSVSIENPFVQVDLDTDTLNRADLTVMAELCNHSDTPVTGTLVGHIDSIVFEQTVTLPAQKQIKAEFTPIQYRQLQVHDPRVWWPHDLGEPNLYDLQLEFHVDNVPCETCHTRFGVRRVEDYFNEAGHRGYKINGRKVLIRAGGWTDDMLLADTSEKLQAQIRYVKHMNLNCIRLEGFWGTDHTLYDLCDKYGILMMVGWSCHWEHEQWLGKPVDERFGGITSAQDIDLIAESWSDQVIWFRNHPSIFVWTVGSDKVPHPDLEQRYVDTFNTDDPTRPYLASTGGVGSEQAIIGEEEIVSDISGPTGVKMLGPYAYTPPVYWYEDTTRGGAYGFNTETGPGAQVPVLETLKKMIPAKELWPMGTSWNFHCGLAEFSTLDRFCQALEKRYGPTDSVEQFAYRAQILNYELMRPMFEAFRVNRGRATGVVQWMLNAAWPKMYWQLYDWYLMPTGAMYGTMKACQPCQLMYDYTEHTVFLVNDRLTGYTDLCAEIRVLDVASDEILCKTLNVDCQPESTQAILSLPSFTDISTTYFLDLRVFASDRTPMAGNFYWLSTQPDILDYQAKVDPWEFYTPSKQFADFTLLNTLATTTVRMQHDLQTRHNDSLLSVTLQNTANAIAFGIEVTALDERTGKAIVPIFWEDNYVTLLPGEARTIKATFSKTAGPVVPAVQGWNIEQP